MNNNPAPVVSTSNLVLSSSAPVPQTSSLGDRIRSLANQLRQEDEIQIKATSRILGAAAKLAENHDRLIDEVVEMVEEDLDQSTQPPNPPYTVEQLKQQFGKLSDAKAHFGIKASSWAALVDKLNKPATASHSPPPQVGYTSQDRVSQRLEAIEHEVQALQSDINQALKLLNLLAEKLLY